MKQRGIIERGRRGTVLAERNLEFYGRGKGFRPVSGGEIIPQGIRSDEREAYANGGSSPVAFHGRHRCSLRQVGLKENP